MRERERQHFSKTLTRKFAKRLNAPFGTEVEIPAIMSRECQEIETLTNEEALLFAKYLRNERKDWIPRIVGLKPCVIEIK